MAWTVRGLEDGDGQRCECCGAACPKRRVVLTDGEHEVRYGSSCAALKLSGDKRPGTVSVVVKQATAAGVARRWLTDGHTAETVSRYIWKRFGFLACPKGVGVNIPGVGIVAGETKQSVG